MKISFLQPAAYTKKSSLPDSFLLMSRNRIVGKSQHVIHLRSLSISTFGSSVGRAQDCNGLLILMSLVRSRPEGYLFAFLCLFLASAERFQRWTPTVGHLKAYCMLLVVNSTIAAVSIARSVMISTPEQLCLLGHVIFGIPKSSSCVRSPPYYVRSHFCRTFPCIFGGNVMTRLKGRSTVTMKEVK